MPIKEFDHLDRTLVYEMGLSQKALGVFNVLYDLKYYKTNSCNPSYATLKKRTGIRSDATISAALKELASNNIISFHNTWRKNSKKKTSNIYKLIPQIYTEPNTHIVNS